MSVRASTVGTFVSLSKGHATGDDCFARRDSTILIGGSILRSCCLAKAGTTEGVGDAAARVNEALPARRVAVSSRCC